MQINNHFGEVTDIKCNEEYQSIRSFFCKKIDISHEYLYGSVFWDMDFYVMEDMNDLFKCESDKDPSAKK